MNISPIRVSGGWLRGPVFSRSWKNELGREDIVLRNGGLWWRIELTSRGGGLDALCAVLDSGEFKLLLKCGKFEWASRGLYELTWLRFAGDCGKRRELLQSQLWSVEFRTNLSVF